MNASALGERLLSQVEVRAQAPQVDCDHSLRLGKVVEIDGHNLKMLGERLATVESGPELLACVYIQDVASSRLELCVCLFRETGRETSRGEVAMTKRTSLFFLDFGTPEVSGKTRVSYAPVNPVFQRAWNSARDVLKRAGFRLFSEDGRWLVAFWSHLSEEDALLEARRMHRALESGWEEKLAKLEESCALASEEWGEEQQARAKALEVTTVVKDGVVMEVTDAGEIAVEPGNDDAAM
ncbi:MAG: hypothetical protein ACQEVA_21545 [Myxococcota bacterium]